MRFDDYRKLPLGMKIEGGEIQRCPDCGELGLAEAKGQRTLFTHYMLNDHAKNTSGASEWKIFQIAGPISAS